MEELRWGVQVGLPAPSWTPPILSGSHPLLGLFPFVGFMRAFARIMCSERDKTAAPWKGAIPKGASRPVSTPPKKHVTTNRRPQTRGLPYQSLRLRPEAGPVACLYLDGIASDHFPGDSRCE